MSDAISRQAAIRWVKTECNPYGKPTIDFESGKKVIEHLEQMSPVQSYTIHSDGRLWVTVDDIDKVNAVVVDESKSKFCKQFYMDAQPESHWIPVTERLPENEVNVLITVEHRPIGRKSYRRVVRAFHEDGTWSDIRSAYSWDDDSWDDYVDEDRIVLIPEGWFEAIDYHGEFCAVDDFVIAWMPLPEPFKGVTT